MTTPDEEQGPAPPPIVPRRTQLVWLAIAAAVLVLIAVVAGFLGHKPDEDSGAAAPPNTFRPSDAQLKTLTIEPVATHKFVPIEFADGRIAVNGDRATPVYSPYSGRVVQLVVHAGDKVAAGAPLAIIEASEIADADSAFHTAAGQERAARADADRKRALYAANGASQQDLQQAEADLAAAEGALSAARNHLRILGQPEAAIAALDTGTPVDARVPLRAPLAGIVVDRELAPGQYISAGTDTAVFTVADVTSLWVVGTLSERAAPRLKRGQAVEVTTPAWPGRTFSARLDFVAPAIDPATHRLSVRATIDNADGALRPEMLATLRIEAGDSRSALAVPASAVVYEGEQVHVWVLRSDGAIGLRPIKVGLSGDGLIEVLDGLAAGERIVTRGSLFIDHAARLD